MFSSADSIFMAASYDVVRRESPAVAGFTERGEPGLLALPVHTLTGLAARDTEAMSRRKQAKPRALKRKCPRTAYR